MTLPLLFSKQEISYREDRPWAPGLAMVWGAKIKIYPHLLF